MILIQAKNMGADAVQNQLIKSFAILLLCASCAGKPTYNAENIRDLARGDNIITLDNGNIINIQKDWGISILDDYSDTESFVFCDIYLNDKAIDFGGNYSVIDTKYDYNKKCQICDIAFEYTPEFLLMIVHRDADNNCAIKEIERYRIDDYKFIRI